MPVQHAETQSVPARASKRSLIGRSGLRIAGSLVEDQQTRDSVAKIVVEALCHPLYFPLRRLVFSRRPLALTL
eukprot:280901-Chlamydomonas_euryale.AAC.1